MIPRAHVTAWRAVVPWADDAQVEQDLVLSRALVELFADPVVRANTALRGGTAFNKLLLAAPARYSEDIDLVQAVPGPIGPVFDAIRARLDPWLGRASYKQTEGRATLRYRFDSELEPVRPLRLKVEINTREQFTVFGLVERVAVVNSPWFSGQAPVTTFTADELFGTKLRALYQRKKSRDLFDVWLALTQQHIDPHRVVEAFVRYRDHDGVTITRGVFERNLDQKLKDPTFVADIAPLLTPATRFDPVAAYEVVRARLVALLPE